MKLLYIYNPESEIERNTLNQIKSDLPSLANDFEAVPFMDVIDKYHISQTPSVVVTLSDMVTDNLLVVDPDTNELGIVSLLKRVNNLEFYTQFNSIIAKQLKEQEITQRVNLGIRDILSSVDNLSGYPTLNAQFATLVDNAVATKLQELSSTNVAAELILLKQQNELLKQQNESLQAQITQTNTDMQSFIDFMFTILSVG